MSRYFVTDAPVPVYEFDAQTTISDRPPNVIWIKARMDVKTQGRVQSELIKLEKSGPGQNFETTTYLGLQQTALLIHNIVRWEGPDFVDDLGRPIPCTPENIYKLDPNEPHIEAVLEAIAERNQKRPSPNPKSQASTNGATSVIDPDSMPGQDDGENLSLQLATTPLKSSLRSAITGRLDKSENSIPTSLKS